MLSLVLYTFSLYIWQRGEEADKATSSYHIFYIQTKLPHNFK